MNWILEAKRIFNSPKPKHFTNFNHCEECAEHNQILLDNNIDTIGLDELGKPGWDPMCFSSEQGKKYYMPALIRLSLDTISNEFYLGKLLSHLENDESGKKLIENCNFEQQEFIASFIKYLIDNHAQEIENNCCLKKAIRIHKAWSEIYA